MQENEQPPVAGKAANRERELQFFGGVEQVHEIRAVRSACQGDVAMTEWVFDVTFKGGARKKWHQVAVQQWKGGKVASEKFYYDTGAVKA